MTWEYLDRDLSGVMGLNFYTIFGATDQRIGIWWSSLTLTLCHNWEKIETRSNNCSIGLHYICITMAAMMCSVFNHQVYPIKGKKIISSLWCVHKRFSLMVHLFTSNVNYKAIQRLNSLVSWANGKLRPTGAEFFVASIETTNVELNLRLSTFVQVLFSHSQKCFIQMHYFCICGNFG